MRTLRKKRGVGRTKKLVAASLVAAALASSSPAYAGAATGLAVSQAVFGPTVAACAASMGPQAVFTGVACATGWVAMGVAWILPF